jgi:two-component system, chemotaxis family, CheB/CheR fusion protein
VKLVRRTGKSRLKRMPKKATAGKRIRKPERASASRSALPVASRPRKRPPSKPASSKRFPVVGIGASAGGLEPLIELLNGLKTDTGMAFVVVQHLDPHTKSILPQILAKATPMPVEQIQNRVEIKPDHVYVIPPNTRVSLSGYVLKLEPRLKEGGMHRCIDYFFLSLARERGPLSAGVVLSGSAFDGTEGSEGIKSAGGVTFAQDEKSAKFDSMPRSAVMAGCIDRVLPPAKIAEELNRLAPSFSAAAAEPDGKDAAEQEQGLRKILQMLRTSSGVDFTLYKPNTIERRIKRRMMLQRFERLSPYINYLQSHPQELEALYLDLLINVTTFFRDPETFEFLKQKIFPQIARNAQPDMPVRIWVMGCSTGQEAYSLAMAFLEFSSRSGKPIPLQIFATDLNETLLERARLGLFTKGQVQAVSPERLRRFFVEEEGGYRISKPIREMCVFARHDITGDPPFSRMDLVSCRNLLIYLESALQKKLIPLFHYALKPSGFLLLGQSETVGGYNNLFTIADKAHKLYVRSHLASLPLAPVLTKSSKPDPVGTKELRPPPVISPEVQIQRETDRIILARYAPAGVVVNDDCEILHFRGRTSPYLEPAQGKASYSLLKMVREGLMLPLRAAINKARKENTSVRKEDLPLRSGRSGRRVSIEVIPLRNIKSRCFLIIFAPAEAVPHAATAALAQGQAEEMLKSSDGQPEVEHLRSELAATQEYLQGMVEQYEGVNEELQAANEEGQSANEELQSINEELETTKEELESTNEELTTVNEEMGSRNQELHRINSDLSNVLKGVQMCIVVLGGDLCIRRFTPLAERVLNLVPTDVGRPITNIRPNIDFPELENFIVSAIDGVQSKEAEVRDREGRWYSLRVLPYKTLENKIDGAVLVLVDVDVIKKSEQQIKGALDYAEDILATVREPLVILDSDLKVESANRSFYHTFRASPDETLHHSIYQISGGQWNLPELRKLLQEVLAENSAFDDLEIESDFERIGRRTMLLNARQIAGAGAGPQRILLAI